MDYITGERIMDDKLTSIYIFLGHSWSAHGHKMKVMNERFSIWIEKHNRVVGSALKLDE
jgi:hypothetical protein